MREPWTDYQKARLKRLCDQGMSYSEAGAMLGRTRNSIAGKAQAMGLLFRGQNRKKNSPKQRAAIVAGLQRFRERDK